MKKFQLDGVAGVTGVVCAVAAGLVAGCSAGVSEDGTAPGVEDPGISEQSVVWSENADGWWSANALAPDQPYEWLKQVFGEATFTGPAGKTRKMGLCLLRDEHASCTTVADCSGVTVPTGGFLYCTAPNLPAYTGPKTCWVRPGPETKDCAGSPALGGTPVAPGTYTTDTVGVGGAGKTVITYACFEGCKVEDPSSSSASTTVTGCTKCGSVCC